MGEGRAQPSRGPGEAAGASPPLRPRCLQPPCRSAGRGVLRRAGAAGRRLPRRVLGCPVLGGGAGRGAAGYAVSGAVPRSRPVAVLGHGPSRPWAPAVGAPGRLERGLERRLCGCRVPLSAWGSPGWGERGSCGRNSWGNYRECGVAAERAAAILRCLGIVSRSRISKCSFRKTDGKVLWLLQGCFTVWEIGLAVGNLFLVFSKVAYFSVTRSVSQGRGPLLG